MSDNNIYDINEQKRSFNWNRHKKPIIFGVITLLLLAFIISNLFIVKENEYRVIRQFGEVVKIVDEPGLSYKVPFIQTVSTLPKYQMMYDVTKAEINTKDKKRIIIDNYAVWRIDDPKKMISNLRTTENAEAKMAEFIFSIFRSELGKLNYDEIINDENSSRGSINERVTKKVNTLLNRDNFGIIVKDVRMKRTDLPDENEESVFLRMISERETKAQQYLSQGDAEKNRIIANTDKEVKQLLAKAQAEAEKIRAQGEKEAANIYNQSFSKDREFYSLYRTLNSYKKTIDDETLIILPKDSPYARLLMGYLE
ncbi:protease modulator HflC [Pseudalkalibacillus berkeleyi]|uniref:Protein HflC n=1 Tax=Pseudalkalibacillus berkeleyi TaxID=1069813 RepID=A0ABS9H204_9BACL|nr:protease modulator HflC [Pseudalkalibacillus berkeleyi]MCF6139002.1 protease modulator HflC [Pseudalkalibacillus berkeleyi]